MRPLIIRHCQVVKEGGIWQDQAVILANSCIQNILPDRDIRETGIGEDGQNKIDQLDARGRLLAPGYIDLHTHGAYSLLIDQDAAILDQLCQVLPQHGITGFLPTLTPGPDPDKEVERLQAYGRRRYSGSGVLGFFLEGHYLALTGALAGLPGDHSPERVRQLIDALHPYRVVFGISPEIPGICDLLPVMTASGFPAFITHTRATVQQTEEAIVAGATHATHFYDVFPYPGDQEPGVRGCGAVEAVLASGHTTVDFILDGEHVDPIAVKMAVKALGPDRVSLITDANMNAGLPPGTFVSLGGQEITVAYEGAPARLGPGTQMPGGLCGSGLTLDRAVRNAVRMLGVSIPEAIAMASAHPARVLGLEQRKGQMTAGYDADLILLDEQLKVTHCWVAGRLVFSPDAGREVT